MRKLEFHFIRAENILCFGPEGASIHFKDYDAVNQIKGINLDAPGTKSDPASNGSGKSSIPEILSIGLYGRTIKKPTKNKGNQIINVLADKGEVEVQWDNYRLVRSFRRSKSGSISSKLQVWKSEDRIWDKESCLDLPTDQLEQEITRSLGLTHHAFCNVFVFDDSNTYSFLEADTPTKRQIIENVMDLERYRDYHQNCKDIIKDLKKQIQSLSAEYSRLQNAIDECKQRIQNTKQQEANWRATKQSELKSLMARITNKQDELKNTDTGKQLIEWQNAQDRISQIQSEIETLEGKKAKLTEAVSVAQNKLVEVLTAKNELQTEIQQEVMSLKSLESDCNKSVGLVSDLESLKEGSSCPTCMGTINRMNYGHVLNHTRDLIAQTRVLIERKNGVINSLKEDFGAKCQQISTMQSRIEEADGRITLLKNEINKSVNEIQQLNLVPKPQGNSIEQVLEAEILELKNQFKSKKEEYEGESPYKEIIEQAEEELVRKEADLEFKGKELQESESELPYFEYWEEAFGDNGIRKFIIEGIIPPLNERISYWLQILIDGLIEVKFDNTLEETITRNGNPASYHNMSKGEIRRINLAVSQSFAYVMMLNSDCCPNIVFLDEITGGGIDRAGAPYVYNMILELAKERQVFVTTHNEILMSLLNGCSTMTLKKENDVTSLVS